MAFQLANFTLKSASVMEPVQGITNLYNTPLPIYIPNSTFVGCFKEFDYYSAVTTPDFNQGTAPITGDSLAQMATAGYFNSVQGSLTVGDVIYTYSAFDGSSSSLLVTGLGTSAVPNVTVLQREAAVAKGTLTAAQIVAMNAAPVTILPAPGATMMYLINNWSMNVTFGVAALTGGGAVSLQYGVTAAAAGLLATATMPVAGYRAAASQFMNAAGVANFSQLATAMANLPISISNDTAAFANGGAGTSTFNYTINYRVLPIA